MTRIIYDFEMNIRNNAGVCPDARDFVGQGLKISHSQQSAEIPRRGALPAEMKTHHLYEHIPFTFLGLNNSFSLISYPHRRCVLIRPSLADPIIRLTRPLR